MTSSFSVYVHWICQRNCRKGNHSSAGSRRPLPSKNYFQICSAYTCAQRRNYTACSRLGWLASLRTMSLYLEEGEKKGSQWPSLSSPTRLTGELAGQLAEICIGCEYCCGNQVSPVDNIHSSYHTTTWLSMNEWINYSTLISKTLNHTSIKRRKQHIIPEQWQEQDSPVGRNQTRTLGGGHLLCRPICS